MALALVISAKKLRPYFQAHTIVVLTNQPLRQVMQKPEASGRLVQWAIELEEHDIQYQPRTKIKRQAVVDFVVEFTSNRLRKERINLGALLVWKLKVKGLLESFVEYTVIQISREENSKADALARLASATDTSLTKLIPMEFAKTKY
ncbi:hypothetical protein WN944_027133 [Citrus x changshan-huyou]|uniref:Reverse transcriptase RNase H-like domain-containing protein n=1 Tax=Citrus x changshan-huyou TaxID=2935761 RepID=A0AAP0Q7X3_9ROSI